MKALFHQSHLYQLAHLSAYLRITYTHPGANFFTILLNLKCFFIFKFPSSKTFGMYQIYLYPLHETHMTLNESFISIFLKSKTLIDLNFSMQYHSIPDSLIHVFLLKGLLNFHLYFKNLIQVLVLHSKCILIAILTFLKRKENQ